MKGGNYWNKNHVWSCKENRVELHAFISIHGSHVDILQ
jgi:hypothetical protein